MKKYAILVLTLVLTAAMLTACGCTNQNMEMTTAPTTLPTTTPTRATSEPTTMPTTAATTEPTTYRDNGNGPLESTNGMETEPSDGIVEGAGNGTNGRNSGSAIGGGNGGSANGGIGNGSGNGGSAGGLGGGVG